MKLGIELRQLFILSTFLILSACQTARITPAPEDKPLGGAPLQKVEETILDHKYFVISYNTRLEIANSVTYHLTREHLMHKITGRSNRFHADEMLLKMNLPAPDEKSYAHSGFQRGHLAPSADFEWNEDANDESFVMSNMTPQRPGLNMFAWRYLETRVRKWACAAGSLEIIVRTILTNVSGKLPNGVAIPTQFYKIILDETPPKKAVGFIYNQDDKRDVYKERVVRVAEIEQRTGIKFFMDLSETERSRVESQAPNLSQWVENKCW